MSGGDILRREALRLSSLCRRTLDVVENEMKSAIANPCAQPLSQWVRAVLMPAVLTIGLSNGIAEGADQRVFATPEQATQALVAALSEGDTERAESILGAEGERLLHSGDAVADQKARKRFLAAYAAQHRLAYDGDSKVVLHVGEEDWPLPIPIIRKNGAWLFDSAAGAEEILNRRIGRNELDAIQVCLAVVDAQRDYALTDHDGSGVRTFARRLASRPRAKDGLYWPTTDDEQPSPLGPLMARAAQEGYPPSIGGRAAPYHGYFYRILTGQGTHAKGGAYDYLVDGKMLGGFALVAYPARYGVSGIMTFIVNHDGAIYEKDLGKETSQLGQSMTLFDPDQTWRRVESESNPVPDG